MKAKYWIISLLGLAAVVAGFILARMGVGSAPLPYVLLGVGCGAFGWGAGELLRQWAVRADPGLENSYASSRRTREISWSPTRQRRALMTRRSIFTAPSCFALL